MMGLLEANDNIPDDEADLAEELCDMYNDPAFDELDYEEFLELLDEVADVFATD